MDVSPELADFLGPNAVHVIADLTEEDVHDRVIQGAESIANVLKELDAFDLDSFEESDLDLPDISLWEEIAPGARNILMLVHTSLERLHELFPGGETSSESEELDLTALETEDDAHASRPRDRRHTDIEEIVRASETVGPAVFSITRSWVGPFPPPDST